MVEASGGYGDRRRGFTRVSSTEEQEEDIEHVLVTNYSSRARQQAVVHPKSDDGGVIQCGSRKVQQVKLILGIVLLYMWVSMSLTLLDKWLMTGMGFNAPLTLISLTYLIMHLVSLSIRTWLRHRGVEEGGGGGDASHLVQRLSWHQWAWKVFPVAAASGLEVGTSALGLKVMHVGVHTMVRSTVPIFVLLFSVGMGLQEFRCGLLAVVMLVSGGVTLLFSGQRNDQEEDFPMDGFLLTLLSGMLAGLKWTLSQVLLQGRGLYGRGAITVGEHIHPFTLLHYMSLSSAASLVPFALALELGALHEMAITFSGHRIVKTGLMIVAVSLLAFMLVLAEFSFIRRVSSLSLCIIAVVKELLLVMFSVLVLGEHLSGRTGLGFFVTMVGVTLYKLVPKGPPQDLPLKNGGGGRQDTASTPLGSLKYSGVSVTPDRSEENGGSGRNKDKEEWQRSQPRGGRLAPIAATSAAPPQGLETMSSEGRLAGGEDAADDAADADALRP
ncbi:unnamed protein product [Ectocarpus sp. 6 AP-2014]